MLRSTLCLICLFFCISDTPILVIVAVAVISVLVPVVLFLIVYRNKTKRIRPNDSNYFKI